MPDNLNQYDEALRLLSMYSSLNVEVLKTVLDEYNKAGMENMLHMKPGSEEAIEQHMLMKGANDFVSQIVNSINECYDIVQRGQTE